MRSAEMAYEFRAPGAAVRFFIGDRACYAVALLALLIYIKRSVPALGLDGA